MRLTATPLLLALSLALGTSMTAHAAPSSPSIAAPAEGTLLNISANAEATRVPDVATLSAGVVSQAADGNSPPVVRHLTPPASAQAPEAQMSEATFRYEVNEDAMATEKLAEGIRLFAADAAKLDALIEAQR